MPNEIPRRVAVWDIGLQVPYQGAWWYKGEIRAVGNVLRDQLAFMARCGFHVV